MSKVGKINVLLAAKASLTKSENACEESFNEMMSE